MKSKSWGTALLIAIIAYMVFIGLRVNTHTVLIESNIRILGKVIDALEIVAERKEAHIYTNWMHVDSMYIFHIKEKFVWRKSDLDQDTPTDSLHSMIMYYHIPLPAGFEWSIERAVRKIGKPKNIERR